MAGSVISVTGLCGWVNQEFCRSDRYLESSHKVKKNILTHEEKDSTETFQYFILIKFRDSNLGEQ